LAYRINGGRGTTPSDQAGFVDQSVTVADGVGFQREGFTFAGWNSAPDGSGASYPPGALYSLGRTGGVLFAQWTPARPAPPVPPDNVLEPIEAPTPPAEDGEEVIFTPLKDLPAPPDDPWNPSSVVLVDPDTKKTTPVVQNDSGDWSVNNRIGNVIYLPSPAFSGTASVVVQLETVSGVRYQSTLQTPVPSCQRGRSVRTTVYFDVLSSKLSAESKRKLNQVVRSAGRAGIPTCTAVVGYVQPTINRANDISLSTSRATSVADYLKTQGVTRIIRTEGLGRADEPGARARRATVRIYIAQPPPALPIDG
jgi:outer membrane protein OmpA-like peptidoglycan-associated protein